MMPAQNSGDFDQGKNFGAKGFTRQQKIGLSVLLVATTAVLVMWYLQLKKNIVYPLYGGINPSELAKQAATTATTTADNGRDTDGDGLTDYQELNTYHTSPYLPDSDSDGLSDGAEVRGNTDPNCPVGKDCGSSFTADSAPQSSNSTSTMPGGGLNLDVLNQLNQSAAGGQVSAGLSATDATTLKQAFGDNPDPAVLRQNFLQAATKAEDQQLLNSMSDEQLLQVYQAMIANAQ